MPGATLTQQLATCAFCSALRTVTAADAPQTLTPTIAYRDIPARATAIRPYLFFGRFAPYFERDCFRSLTPWVSSEPRTMW